MKKSKSSARWISEHENDEYVQRARREGYRSRATYKLLEIDDKYHLLKPGLTVVDLGAAPGGWTQVAVKRVAEAGLVIGLDILAMEPVDGAVCLQADFTGEAALTALEEVLGGRQIDLVISDMAPNLSGMKDIDQPRAVYLVELALDFAEQHLQQGGAFLAKCFEGEGIDPIRESIRNKFKQLNNVKPKASRGKSREIYLLGRGFKG
jgi:23S rRNA (uridine2552-2'-O)-methyltransferase